MPRTGKRKPLSGLAITSTAGSWWAGNRDAGVRLHCLPDIDLAEETAAKHKEKEKDNAPSSWAVG